MHRRLLPLFALLLGVLLTIGYSWTTDQSPLPLSAIAEDVASTPTANQSSSSGELNPAASEDAALESESLLQGANVRSAAQQAFRRAMNSASRAAELAQTAQAPQAWDRVAESWMAAIAELMTIPPQSPQRVFAQRKAQEYLQNLKTAQRNAMIGSFPQLSPSLGSASLNEQLVLYRSYIETMGLPDVLIVGSSRSLQGVDPEILQQSLATRGYSGVKAYNFGIHGATAQVINTLLQQILTPDQLPKLIVWPEGSRAFNSGRPDRTYQSIVTSEGYRTLASSGQASTLKFLVPNSVAAAPQQTLMQANGYGFIAVSEQFDPNRYYQQHPRVAGRYDADYQNFSLNGVQGNSLRALAQFSRAQGITLVYVNLPLTQTYLDAVRSRHEQQYRQWMQTLSREGGFVFVDLAAEPTLSRNEYFVDPSHINRHGAAAIARRLATHPQMPWTVLRYRESLG